MLKDSVHIKLLPPPPLLPMDPVSDAGVETDPHSPSPTHIYFLWIPQSTLWSLMLGWRLIRILPPPHLYFLWIPQSTLWSLMLEWRKIHILPPLPTSTSYGPPACLVNADLEMAIFQRNCIFLGRIKFKKNFRLFK